MLSGLTSQTSSPRTQVQNSKGWTQGVGDMRENWDFGEQCLGTSPGVLSQVVERTAGLARSHQASSNGPFYHTDQKGQVVIRPGNKLEEAACGNLRGTVTFPMLRI